MCIMYRCIDKEAPKHAVQRVVCGVAASLRAFLTAIIP
jgi:hypothetical protein